MASSHKLINQLDNPLYALLLQGIKFYKWIEWILIYIFQGPVFWYMNKSYEKGDIIIGGNRSWDIKLQPRHRKEFYHRLANNASLGLGETYMEGYWECDDICELSYRIFAHKVYTDYLHPINRAVNYLMFHVFNLQTKARAWRVAEEHYDIGNDLFESFLDPTMNYSCGYWANGCDNLNQAQINKMDLIAKKLKLKPGMKVLDIGCGWGGLCKHLAEKYKVECVGITISKEGAAIGQERCANLPVDIRLMDYRDLNEQFDRVVSVGMFEHVGRSNYKQFFNIVRNNLKDDGVFLLHTIGVGHRCVPEIEPWFHKYIFPNGVLPRDDIITKDIQDLFIIEDWHNFSNDYSKTLIAWYQNFIKSWPKRTHPKGTRFYRMWTYYLLMCAGAFKSRKYQLWQIVLSKDGLIGGYESVR